MKQISIDIESYSPVNLKQSGVYPYAEHPDFELLLFGYAVDGGPRRVVDVIQGEHIPNDVVAALIDPDVLKKAFNANFEITCLSRHFSWPLLAEQWRCTSVLALSLGLPGSLADAAEVCKLPRDKRKMGIGTALIRYFCIPCRPTRVNGGRTRNYPHHAPEKWELFKEYCAQDVTTEMAISDKLSRWPLPAHEQALWVLDQEINSRGWSIDQALVSSAIRMNEEQRDELTAEFAALTGLKKATQVAKLKAWLYDEKEIVVESLNKAAVSRLLNLTRDSDVERVLQLRQELSKSSITKYKAMARSVCADGRIRGLFQFCGANRTWRWAGRLTQVHNLPKSDMGLPDLMLARELVKSSDRETVEMCFGPQAPLLSQLIRSALTPPPGKLYVIVDFSAIEARVLAWLAGEEWRMEVFRGHGRIYEASASQMFKVPIESIGKKSPLRQKGKISELALGFHGSVGALITMGALSMGLTLEELQPLVDAWRAANPNIMKFGKKMEADAKQCLRQKIPCGVPGRYLFRYESGILFMDLPSGRSLCYVKPRIEKSELTGYSNITYDGQDQITKQWGRADTYAGKLLENLTQAVARDCLAVALMRLSGAGYEIVGHVHDEVILEVDAPLAEEVLSCAERIFSTPIPWAPGLPLRGDGFISPFYRKD
jgi:DNA polymerase